MPLKNSSGEDVRPGVIASPLDTVDLPGSRGTANLAVKWAKDARSAASLSIQHIKGVTRTFTAEDGRAYVPVVAFECRGLEPIAWEPRDTFTIKAPSGTTWEDADISSLEWSEYDEKAGDSVSVTDLEYKFETYREKK